jgi:rhodanese-related sulfurtransferase
MIRTIDRDEVQRAVNAVIVEVLPRSYYDAGHLPGAIHLPLEAVSKADIPRDARVILYCASATCANSHQAAERLERAGYTDVSVYAGGKADWRDAGLPLEVSR